MSSMKKNVLAVALVAGLGLTGAAAAYNYGTAAFATTETTGDSSASSPAGILTPEPVAYQQLLGGAWNYTMAEDLVFDIQIPDNAVQITTGFTVRVKLNRNGCVPSGLPYPASDTTCADTNDGALFNTSYTPTSPATVGAYAGEDLELNATLRAAGWQAQFDGYYDGGRTASIRIIPAPGNNANPGPGVMLRWHHARLTSLDELADGRTTKVDAEFWMVNSSNDSRFTGSTMSRTILQRVTGMTACADTLDAEVDKYIDVADRWAESTMPKSRFSADGKLGTAEDSGYDSQTINLGDVVLSNNGGGSFLFAAGDTFSTVLSAGASDNWLAFDNDHLNVAPPYNDDVWLTTGTCQSGSVLARGEVEGNLVTFQTYTALAAGFTTSPGAQTVRLTVCAYADSDVVIDDHNINVATTFYRPLAFATPTFADASCKLLPLRYNGSTMEIFTINPGSNDTQRSFIRLTNRSATDGYVSLEGIDNLGAQAYEDANGHARPQVRVWVPAGASVQLDAADLENGTNGAIGAWGTGAGKWRAVVTAEFPGLVATSLVNSALPRVLTNITDSDTRGEQYDRDFNEGNFANEAGYRSSDFLQESTPDFRGNGESTGQPGGPNGSDGPAGGTTAPCGNEGNGDGNAVDGGHDQSNEDPYCYQAP